MTTRLSVLRVPDPYDMIMISNKRGSQEHRSRYLYPYIDDIKQVSLQVMSLKKNV